MLKMLKNCLYETPYKLTVSRLLNSTYFIIVLKYLTIRQGNVGQSVEI